MCSGPACLQPAWGAAARRRVTPAPIACQSSSRPPWGLSAPCPRRLPARPITVVVRTDASGTTQQVTEYLAADPAAWQLGAGKTVGWPKCVVTVQGSDGVVAYTAANALSIGRAARGAPPGAGLLTGA